MLPEPMRMEIRILGPLVVQVGANEVSVVGSLRRAVLLRLVLSSDNWLDAARLSDAVWGGDQAAGAANRLQAQITLLRRALGTDALLTQGSSYRLDPDRVVIDSELFERDVTQARSLLHAGRPHEAVTVARSALARWRGPPLVDIASYEWAMSTIAYLTELKGLAHEVLLESLLAAELFADVVVAAELAVAEQPLRESLWRSLMLALARSGRTAESARAFLRLRNVMREEVGLDPSPELANLDASILAGAYSPNAVEGPTGERDQRIAESLPRFATPMIGRQREVDEIGQAVAKGGLVTLVGAGGVGKTRIAVAVAGLVKESFPDGVWFVDLATVAESSGVATAACRTIGLTVNPTDALDQLRRSMAATKALVILDNCEQVLDGAAQLAEALGSAKGGFCLLTTSREPLAVEHEIVRPIRSLPIGDVGSGGAVDLFVRRASDLGGALGPDDYPVVTEICRRLDGLPLAIELAATRVRALGPSDLLEALSERLDSLRSTRKFARRHRTLRATVEWSFELLDRRQQLGFSLIAVFLGGFDLRAAQAILATEGFTAGDTIDLLSELVDKSMIEVESGVSGQRFRLLETLRQFAVERLLKHGPEIARDEHAVYYARRVADLLTILRGPREKEASDAFLVEDGNIRSAFEWSMSREDFEIAASIAEAAWEFGYQRMNYEALDWIEAMYDEALHRGIAAMPALAAIRGITGWVRSGVPDGMAWVEEAYRLAGELAIAPPYRVLQSEAQLLNSRDPARSLVVLQTLADRAAAAGSQHVEAWALWMRAFAAFWSEPRTSLEPSLRAVELCRTYGQPTAIAASLGALALAYSVSDPRRALELSTEACSIATAADSTWIAAQCQLLSGSVQAGLAKSESGEVLNRTIDQWVDNLARSGNLSMRWRMLSNVVPLVLTRSPADFAVAVGIFRSRQVEDRPGWARAVERARRLLGEFEFEHFVEHGRALSDAEAISLLRGPRVPNVQDADT